MSMNIKSATLLYIELCGFHHMSHHCWWPKPRQWIIFTSNIKLTPIVFTVRKQGSITMSALDLVWIWYLVNNRAHFTNICSDSDTFTSHEWGGIHLIYGVNTLLIGYYSIYYNCQKIICQMRHFFLFSVDYLITKWFSVIKSIYVHYVHSLHTGAHQQQRHRYFSSEESVCVAGMWGIHVLLVSVLNSQNKTKV